VVVKTISVIYKPSALLAINAKQINLTFDSGDIFTVRYELPGLQDTFQLGATVCYSGLSLAQLVFKKCYMINGKYPIRDLNEDRTFKF